MILLGILMAGAAVCVAVGIVAHNSAPATLSVFGQHVPGVTSQAQVFVAGIIVSIFFVIGLAIASLAWDARCGYGRNSATSARSARSH